MGRLLPVLLFLGVVATNAAAHAQDAGVQPAPESPGPGEESPGPVFGAHAHALRAPPPHGTSEFFTNTEHVADVPHANVSTMLQSAAPGLLVTNEGGEGHAEGYVLRGFQADEGTGLEVIVDGVPINEPGNPHAEGLADAHFVIPELVSAMRVLEGPFDPRQGNYAVGGTAEYLLGLPHPTLSLSYGAGAWATQRAVGLFRPEGSAPGTFLGVEARTSDGFGQNRASQRASVMGGLELKVSRTVVLRTLVTAYVSHYATAGYRRDGDPGHFDTYDATQGGDASRLSASATLEERRPQLGWRQLVFVARRDERVLDDTTGVALDARGDATEQRYGATTFGARGSVRFSRAAGDLGQALELGYHARLDLTDASQKRMLFQTTTPYATDADVGGVLGNVAVYADGELRPLPLVVLRGGARLDYHAWDVAQRTTPGPHVFADGFFPGPRGSLTFGPVEGLSLSTSAGLGSRTADPISLVDVPKVTVARVASADLGLRLERTIGDFTLDARALGYFTYVSHDSLFDPEQGRFVSTPATTRQGLTASARVHGPWIEAAASVTYADARYAADVDPAEAAPGGRVPYVPEWIGRLDAAVWHPLFDWSVEGRAVTGRAALGLTVVSQRPLPGAFGASDAYALLDASIAVRCAGIEVGITGQNLLDMRYRPVELPYASQFTPGAATGPDVRHYVAGAPLYVLATVTVHFERDAWAATAR